MLSCASSKDESVENIPYLSIVIPAYNEEWRLPPYLLEIETYFRHQGRYDQIEIIVADDGSQDRTSTIVESFQQKGFPVHLIRLPANRGKGYAVRTGMLSARGKLCLVADADGATPIHEVAKLEEQINQGAHIAIGSRALYDPTCVLHVRWHRKYLGRIFHLFVRALGVRGLTDTQCGFKLFRHCIAHNLFSALQLHRYGYDVELLFLAQRRGYRVAEVAVNWTDRPGSKVRVLNDGIRMLWDLWTVRRNYLHGLYPSQKTMCLRHEVASLEGKPVVE